MKRITYLLVAIIVSIVGNGCDQPANTAHQIVGILVSPEEVAIGNTVTLTCVVQDDDVSELDYQWQSASGTFQGAAESQSIEWKAPIEPGEYEITVLVSDDEFEDEHTQSIEVIDPSIVGEPTVGVYYYPWYGDDNFHGKKYMRERLVPVQLPELGEYNDRDTEVIAQHLAWSEYAGIDVWVSSWWGPGRMTDITLKDHILEHDDLGDMKIALFYETSGRMPNFTDQSNVEADIAYMAEHYFGHPNYYTINGQPVLFVYLTRVLSNNGNLASTMSMMRGAASAAGYALYIVGDQVFGQPPSSTDQIALLDAITNYDVYGSSGAKMYATQQKVDNYYQAQSGWRSVAHQAGKSFIPAASPGFNDTGVRDGHIPLSRKLTSDDEFGSLFKAMVEQALTLVDRKSDNLFVITSWNEWHEDTQIEPIATAPATSIDDSQSQEDYTAGMEYEGYGTRYLDILKDLIPEEEE